MGKPQKKPNLVVKSNAFAESRYMLSISGFRLLAAVISKIDRRSPISHEDMYRVTVEDWIELFGGHPKTAYRDMENAARSIRESWITTFAPPNGKGDKPVEREINWVQMCQYMPGEGSVGVVFTKFIIPYLSQLESNFLSYELEQIARLKSPYSVRIFELCLAHKHRGEVTYSLDDLRFLFRLEKSRSYQRTDTFQDRVTKPALKEINKHTDMCLSCDPVKEGRKLVGLRFHWTMKSSVIKPAKKKQDGGEEKPPIEAEKGDATPVAPQDGGDEAKPEKPEPTETKPETSVPPPPPASTSLNRSLFADEEPAKEPRAHRLPKDWVLPPEWMKWAIWDSGQKNMPLSEAEIADQADQFADYWHAKSGKDARKTDWKATWRNWIRRHLSMRAERDSRYKNGKRKSGARLYDRMEYRKQGQPTALELARQKGNVVG